MIRPTSVVALALFWACVAGSGRIAAQTVLRDESTGERVISYTVRGELFQARVPGNDRIEPDLRTTEIAESSGVFTYRFVVVNRRGGRALQGRGLWMFDLPCTAETAADLTAPAGQWLPEVMTNGQETYCRFSILGERELQPGDSAGPFFIKSRALPGFQVARVYGVAGPHVIPTDEDDTPDAVRDLVRELRAPGGSGSGVEVQVVVPRFDPRVLPGPITVIQLLRADLLLMCGQLGWVSNRGSCRSLQVKLEQAEAALVEDDNEGAWRHIHAFRNELGAQRGKHVSEQAFVLLAALAGSLEGQM